MYLLHLPRFGRKPFPITVADTMTSQQLQFESEDALRAFVDTEFDSLFVVGEVVIYSWVDRVKQIFEDIYGALQPAHSEVDDTGHHSQSGEDDIDLENAMASLSTSLNADLNHELDQEENAGPFVMPPGCPDIHSSEIPLVDRKSIFVAHVATVTTVAQVQLVKQALLSNKRIARATHNIAAYRIVDPNGVVRQDCDDDGETAAGGRLLHLLQLTDACNVYVVVTRWYGGIHLGPARFKHINNIAREILEARGYVRRQLSSGDAAGQTTNLSSKHSGKKRK
eukprot:jgi/Hompol1/1664/HPOL_002740-RA